MEEKKKVDKKKARDKKKRRNSKTEEKEEGQKMKKRKIEEKVEHEKRTAPIVKEAKVAFHDHFRVAVKERKKKSELFFPGIIGAIVGILIYFMFQYNSTATAVILLSAISLGFIVYL